MRAIAAVLFVAGMLAVTSFSDAQPLGQPGQPGKGGKGGAGGKGGFGGGFGGFAQPGVIMPVFMQDMLKMTDAQKKDLEALQKDIDAKLDKLLTEDQRKQLKEMKEKGAGFGGGFGGKGGDGKGGGKGGKGGNPPPPNQE